MSDKNTKKPTDEEVAAAFYNADASFGDRSVPFLAGIVADVLKMEYGEVIVALERYESGGDK